MHTATGKKGRMSLVRYAALCVMTASLLLAASCNGDEEKEPVGLNPVIKNVSTVEKAAHAPSKREKDKPETASDKKEYPRRDERDGMCRVIELYGFDDKNVLAAMRKAPRHEFVPENAQRAAYRDGPLPIGHGQTISQPYIVAEMTRLIRLKEDSRVLEIGTGSGYQAAVLAEVTPHVYSIEIIKPLADTAAKRLEKLGDDKVNVRHGDGFYGWEEHAPFDAIIVTAAAGQIPPPLIKQLAPGGVMVIPVGGAFSIQTLMLVEKDSRGVVTSRSLMAVRFVPLTRAKEEEVSE